MLDHVDGGKKTLHGLVVVAVVIEVQTQIIDTDYDILEACYLGNRK